MRKSLPAAAIALTLLAGCSHSSSSSNAKKDAAATTPASSSPSLPPMYIPPSDGTTTTGGGTTGGGNDSGGTTAQGAGTPTQATPSHISAGIDALRTTWVTATVTRTGPGACVGLTSTDGTAYAVYLTQSVTLTTGMKVRARIVPGKTKTDCGAGRPGRSDSVLIAG
jgi:hypothetical protein